MRSYVDAQSDIILYSGGAKPGDTHLLSTVHCVDEEIIEWLAGRERQRRLRAHITKNPIVAATRCRLRRQCRE
jgi:hypothetical protein